MGRGLQMGRHSHGSQAYLPLHINARVVLHSVASNEGLGDSRLTALSHMVGAVVVHEQGA